MGDEPSDRSIILVVAAAPGGPAVPSCQAGASDAPASGVLTCCSRPNHKSRRSLMKPCLRGRGRPEPGGAPWQQVPTPPQPCHPHPTPPLGALSSPLLHRADCSNLHFTTLCSALPTLAPLCISAPGCPPCPPKALPDLYSRPARLASLCHCPPPPPSPGSPVPPLSQSLPCRLLLLSRRCCLVASWGN